MDERFGGFALGLWLGLTMPLVVHIGIVLLIRQPGIALARIIRFVVAPAALLGLFGVAAALGQSEALANWHVLGVLAGVMLYGVSAWLNRKRTTLGRP